MIKVICFSLIFFAANKDLKAEESNNILNILLNLKPYSESIYSPMPVEVCKTDSRGRNKKCHLEIVSEKDPSKFELIIDKIENSYKIDEEFLRSKLGEEYNELKNYLKIVKDFEQCRSSKSNLTSENILDKNLLLYEAEILETGCDNQLQTGLEEILNFKGQIDKSLDFFIKPNYRESQLIEDLLFGNIAESVKAHVNFLLKFQDESNNSLSDKDILNKLCAGSKVSKIEYSSSRGKKYRNKIETVDLCSDDMKKVIAEAIKKEKMNLKGMEDDKNLTEKVGTSNNCYVTGSGRNKKTKCSESDIYNYINNENKENKNETRFKIQNTTANINQKITKFNLILDQYRLKKKELVQIWDEENKKIKEGLNKRQNERRLSRLNNQRKGKLKKLKSEVYNEYLSAFRNEHEFGAGSLLQTEIIKKNAGIFELEKSIPKFMGLGGFEDQALSDDSNFKKLRLINEDTGKDAVKEALDRTENQVGNLLEMYRSLNKHEDEVKNQLSKTDSVQAKNLLKESDRVQKMGLLEELLQKGPGVSSQYLRMKPEYTDLYCEISKKISKEESIEEIAEMGTYIVVGGGMTIAAIATLGGALPGYAMIGAAGAGVIFTAADYKYQNFKKEKKFDRYEDLLSSYLSGTSGNKAIDSIRNEWKASMEADYSAKMTLGFGIFDLLGIPPAARAGAFLRLTNKIENLDHTLSQNRKLLTKITNNDRLITFTRNLLDKYGSKKVGEMLTEIANLPLSEQKAFLKDLSKMGKNWSDLDLAKIIRSNSKKKSIHGSAYLNLEKKLYPNGKIKLTDKEKIEFLTDPIYGKELFQVVNSSEEHELILDVIVAQELMGAKKSTIVKKIKESRTSCSI